MRLLRFSSLRNYIKSEPAIVTIGNFDGVHLGHRYIINYIQKIAECHDRKSIVVIFEPQTKEFFSKKSTQPLRITTFREKIYLMKTLKIDQVLCLRFNKGIAMLPAEKFIKNIIIDGLNAKHIVVGNDFLFGYKREGNFKLLKILGEKYSFEVESLPPLMLDGTRISSSNIRKLISKGKVDQVKRFLGHYYSLNERIRYGNKNGRKIGFPTINMPISKPIIVSGVYVVNIFIKDTKYNGIANIGIRPTINGKSCIMETHIFNFKDNLYGQYVKVELLYFLREEKKFKDLNELRKQINVDKIQAISWRKENIEVI